MKQAVVLIHGIGEQKPMDTVRGFVESVLPPPVNGGEQYWSKPDPMSESFELRRLQAVGRNKIHFFEYSMAYDKVAQLASTAVSRHPSTAVCYH